MNNEPADASRETFPAAHAYIQISHADGSFSEVGVNLAPAYGSHDVEDALAECRTPREVLACLLHFAQDESAPGEDENLPHFERVSLSDDDIADSERLLREALDEMDPDA
jgi:hypothetical protein